MPALANPRWERFAQLIVIGLLNGDRKSYSQGRAYIAAGYEAKELANEADQPKSMLLACSTALNPSSIASVNSKPRQLNTSRKTQPK
jgi:hypothetical protein